MKTSYVSLKKTSYVSLKKTSYVNLMKPHIVKLIKSSYVNLFMKTSYGNPTRTSIWKTNENTKETTSEPDIENPKRTSNYENLMRTLIKRKKNLHAVYF